MATVSNRGDGEIEWTERELELVRQTAQGVTDAVVPYAAALAVTAAVALVLSIVALVASL